MPAVNAYIPDDLAERVKAEADGDLPFSQLLQAAIYEELARRAAVTATLQDEQTYELDLEDKNGRPFRGRITGKRISIVADDDGEVYLTSDGRVIFHDPNMAQYRVLEDPEADLQEVMDGPAYLDAMQALGLKAIVDL